MKFAVLTWANGQYAIVEVATCNLFDDGWHRITIKSVIDFVWTKGNLEETKKYLLGIRFPVSESHLFDDLELARIMVMLDLVRKK